MIKHRIQLVDLLKELNLPLIAAEVGVAEGNFSRDLLVAGIEEIFMIDNWGQIKGQAGDGSNSNEWHFENFQSAMDKIDTPSFKNKKINVLKGISYEQSAEIEDNYLSLAYIDCDHSLQGVLRDLVAFYPKVIKGGVIAGHDFLNPAYGVKEAVEKFCDGMFEINTIPENNPNDASFYFIKK